MGGYLDFYKKGSGIHIKEKNKGSFTDYCGGKVTEECIQKGKHSKNPKTRKRATFADNVRHFKHQTGGRVFYMSDSLTTDSSPFYQPLISRIKDWSRQETVEPSEETVDTGWDDLFNVSSSSQQRTVSHSSWQGARGYRNFNPLNIRISNNNWLGKLAHNTDGAFEQFQDMAHGFRAGLMNLRSYIKQGRNTVSKIIEKWAPSSENDTNSYVQNVLQRTGFKADQVIDPNNKEQMTKLAYAMAISENGTAPDMKDIEAGWNLLS